MSTQSSTNSAGAACETNAAARSPAGSFAGERRDAVRFPCGGPIWWKGPQGTTFAVGWLIERSTEGVAFLTRGKIDVVEGERVQVSTNDPTDVSFETQPGLVSRTNHVHADLYLVAAQLSAPVGA